VDKDHGEAPKAKGAEHKKAGLVQAGFRIAVDDPTAQEHIHQKAEKMQERE
jgi:hypothetical protein